MKTRGSKRVPDVSTSSSETESVREDKLPSTRRRKPRKTTKKSIADKAPCVAVTETKSYDADSELSSFDSPPFNRRSSRLSGVADPYAFESLTGDPVGSTTKETSFTNKDEQKPHSSRPKPSQQISNSSVVATKKDQDTIPLDRPKAIVKLIDIVSTPTEGLQSSLKRKKSANASGKHRVSFSDISYIKDDGPPHRNSSREVPSKSLKTSTPAQNKDTKQPRLSDIASPILSDKISSAISSSNHYTESPESSGYGSMLKATENLEDSYLYRAPESRKRKQEEQKSQPSRKQQKKLAIKKIKEQEDKYLAELKELEDFALCIE